MKGFLEMFNNRSRWFDHTFRLLKMGFKDLSMPLIESTLISLKRDELNDSQRDFLIACLENLTKTNDAELSFYRKFKRGKQRRATALRDMSVAVFVYLKVHEGLKVEDAIQEAMKFSDSEFPDAYHDYKSIEAAYYRYKTEIVKELSV